MICHLFSAKIHRNIPEFNPDLAQGRAILNILILLTGCKPAGDSSKEEWTPLFNGKDLTGWDIKIAGRDLNDNLNHNFKVADGVMKVDYSEFPRFDGDFGHIYYYEPYSYYRVRLEYKFTGRQLDGGPSWANMNSGIMLHSQSAKSLDKNQAFPVSLEMQFLASDEKDKRHTGNLCTPGTEVYQKDQRVEAHCIDSDSEYYPLEQWVKAEAVVLGDSVIHHIINGDTVLTYQRPHISELFVGKDNTWAFGGVSDSLRWIQKKDMSLGEGYIALQAESQPVEFRKIELLNLKGCMDPKALNYKSYYLKQDNSKCQYK
jgi:hypothetical protein